MSDVARRRRGFAGEPAGFPRARTTERAAAGTRRDGAGRDAEDREPRAGHSRARGVARRRPLVDGGAGGSALLRGRPRERTERLRVPRPGPAMLVHEECRGVIGTPSGRRRRCREPRRRRCPARRLARGALPARGGTRRNRPACGD